MGTEAAVDDLKVVVEALCGDLLEPVVLAARDEETNVITWVLCVWVRFLANIRVSKRHFSWRGHHHLKRVTVTSQEWPCLKLRCD